MDQQNDKDAGASRACGRCCNSLVLMKNTVSVRPDPNLSVRESQEADAFYAIQRSHMQCVIDRLRLKVSKLKTQLQKAQTQLEAQQARADRLQQQMDDSSPSLASSTDEIYTPKILVSKLEAMAKRA